MRAGLTYLPNAGSFTFTYLPTTNLHNRGALPTNLVAGALPTYLMQGGGFIYQMRGEGAYLPNERLAYLLNEGAFLIGVVCLLNWGLPEGPHNF